MSRDAVIEQIFTTADDAIQGLWGLHKFVDAAVNCADRDSLTQQLPNGAFQLTPEWMRYYKREDLVKEIDVVFEFIHCRNSLVLLVSIFEGTILRFNERLVALQKESKAEKYKKLLGWLVSLVRNTKSGSATMQNRLPQTCGDIDNARRLRNCFSHNNGRYNQFYVDDAINDGWIRVQNHSMDPSAISKGDKIFIANPELERLLKSHVEVLHIVHNTIQHNFFGEVQDYNYQVEGKQIEWHRILTGQSFIGM